MALDVLPGTEGTEHPWGEARPSPLPPPRTPFAKRRQKIATPSWLLKRLKMALKTAEDDFETTSSRHLRDKTIQDAFRRDLHPNLAHLGGAQVAKSVVFL